MLELLDLLIRPTLETVAMVAASTLAAVLLGAPVGLFLYLIAPGGLSERPALRRVLDRAINALRSFPFIILMIMLFPLSRILIGTSIGTAAAIVPLTIAMARGAPPSRTGSANARCIGASKPSIWPPAPVMR